MKVKHEMELDRTKMSMISWICGFTMKDKKKSAELREPISLNTYIIKMIMRQMKLRGKWDSIKEDMKSFDLSQEDVQVQFKFFFFFSWHTLLEHCCVHH